MFLYQAKREISHKYLESNHPLSNLDKRLRNSIDPSDVTNIVQQTLVLIGNVHNIFMTDNHQTSLSKLLPKSMDLVNDSS
jgi:hypothetical protein